MRVLCALAFVILVAPAALACTPPQPPLDAFTSITFEDGVRTNIRGPEDGNYAQTMIRINLADGTWEDDGRYKAWPSRGPDNHTAGRLMLDWNWGNQCCLCGPYHSGFQVLRDNRTLATYGGPDSHDAPPMEGVAAQAGTDSIIVWERGQRLVRYTQDGVEHFDAPATDPDKWFVQGEAFLAFSQQKLVHLNETAQEYEMPGNLRKVQWSDPPVLMGWHWVATFDGGLRDVVEWRWAEVHGAYLINGQDRRIATYPGNETLRTFENTIKVIHHEDLWVFETKLRDPDNQWSGRDPVAIHRYNGTWITYTKDWSDPNATWDAQGPAPVTPSPTKSPAESPNATPGPSQESPHLFLLPLLVALLLRRRR